MLPSGYPTIAYSQYDSYSLDVEVYNTLTSDDSPNDFDGGNNLINVIEQTEVFIDPLIGDLRLCNGSVALDAGMDLSASGITTDIIEAARPSGSGYDIGAFEGDYGSVVEHTEEPIGGYKYWSNGRGWTGLK